MNAADTNREAARYRAVAYAERTAREIAERRRPVVLVGPPGVGKTMIARRVADYLPALSDLERTWIAMEFERLDARPSGRPFRAPHYTCSGAALCGFYDKRHQVSCPALSERARPCSCTKERTFRPGEVQLARFGVLFLDELAEFPIAALDGLGGRLRDMGTTAPLIVASALPCPCGWKGGQRSCTCPPAAVARYQERLARCQATLGRLAGFSFVRREIV